MKLLLNLILLFICINICSAQEINLSNLKQLTDGGDNAEAYFSPNGKYLSMQVTNPEIGASCDQIFLKAVSDSSTSNLKLISTGKGRTTCSFFLPDGQHILYASTHESQENCPPPPAPRKDGKYLWAVYPEFDIYVANLNGKIVRTLVKNKGYDAEAVLSPNGKMIVFTSIRSGDLELWTMNIDGSNLKQLTFGLGYDGGAFFSHNNNKIVFRASRPSTEFEIKEYKSLLKEHLVMPTKMELYTINIDGSGLKKITNLGKANWAPYFTPKDDRIIFASNHHSTQGYDFQLFTIDTNGQNLRQITYESKFNAFPMFSPDGKKLAFSSNRNQSKPKETNVFVADWIEEDLATIPSVQNILQSITILASDSLEGRLSGSRGEKLASNYIESKFIEYKLSPLIDQFKIPFEYKYRSDPHDSTENSSQRIQSNNVVGFINNNQKKTIVIGAHYDHLGRNEHHNSTAPKLKGEIHNGADDNASGVAAILELARIFKQNKLVENFNIIFALFSGEEDGLTGSKAFVEYLPNKKIKVDAMINLDMIGRLDSMRNLQIGGVATNPEFIKIVNQIKPGGFNLTLDSSGVGPSDHTSFYLRDIPVLFFFTGSHSDYHKPSDDVAKININGVKLISEYIYHVINSIGDLNVIKFSKTKMKSEKIVPKYKVTMGIMPDYTDHGDGLHIEEVIEGRIAELAGLQRGDILTAIGECKIKEIYSYMDCLAKFKKGDKVLIQFRRNSLLKNVHLIF